MNFLCVYRKIRSKRLAPVLIKEVTRRVNRNDGWQAIYTAGVSIPTPITEANYYHRALNVKKLIDIGFANTPRRITLAGYIRFLHVPEVVDRPFSHLAIHHPRDSSAEEGGRAAGDPAAADVPQTVITCGGSER